jgi:peptidoglycan/xylan/chitin deacetylase (PgdA/CDA1 family)
MNGRALRWILSLAHRPRRNGVHATLVIVRHHRVYAANERPLYRLGVSESVLAGQLALLARAGLAPLTVREGLARLGEERPGTYVAFTFDDGYRDNVTRALPLLAAHGARATFYLTAGLMERRLAPWWDDLAHALEHPARASAAVEWDGKRIALELASEGGRRAALEALRPGLRLPPGAQAVWLEHLRDALGAREPAPCELASWSEAARIPEAGMEVGAHTLSHPFLSLLDSHDQHGEIAGSVELVHERLGVRPSGFAYPGGDHDARTLDHVEALALEHAVTTRTGDNGSGSPRFALRRRGLSDGACLDPRGRFSARLARAELDGAFDRWRGVERLP